MTRPAGIDPAFLALPFERLADAALARAKARGATYADFRFERLRVHTVVARDRELESSIGNESIGFSVRLIHKGAWGFAAGIDLTTDAAAAVALRAIEVADTLAQLNTEPVVLAPEPAYTDTYVSDCEIDPFTVPDQEKTNFLLALNDRALGSGKIDRVTSYVFLVSEQKFFASLSGARILQQRTRVKGDLTAVRIDKATGGFETMGSATPPAGRGWEHFTKGCDLAKDAEEIPTLLEEKMASPSIEPGRYDLVIAPTNLWLTIHESIGHSTELDRVLGYEANYAGTSFATLDKLNTLQFGSPIMHVTGDRQVEWGLSTVGYDDEGVAAQTWDIVRDGVLVGYQLDRQMAQKQGFGRSNGCAFADAADKVPMQRMPNVSLQPSPKNITLADLIGAVDDGIYIVGDKSWSIDMQRYNFQFTGQKFLRIRGGKIVGQVKDIAYQARTTDFWNSMEAVGGPSTYVLGGAFNCGKGQPSQVAPVTHGCPPALFRKINILNTAQEGTLIDLQGSIERVLRLSQADACMVIGQQEGATNIRWANNTVTTNGAVDRASLSIVSIIGRRVASVTRTHFPPDQIETMVRESEAACRQRPEAPDYVALVEPPHGVPGDSAALADWGARPPEADIHALDVFVPRLGEFFERARGSNVQTFGFAEHDHSTTWLATSTGVRRCHRESLGKVEITGKTPDFKQSSWVGRVTADFQDVDPRVLLDSLRQRLEWSERKIDLPAGLYEVLLEPSCTADLALRAYDYMTRRDADEGRSPFSRAGGGTQLGERLFGKVTMYSDPDERGVRTAPFHAGLDSSSAASVFDNGVPLRRTEWVRDGILQTLVTPRYWAAKAETTPVLFVNNLVVTGDGPTGPAGPTLEEMIARTERALLVTCLWYIRTVDPQTALETGLTRDGVFLVERGKVVGAVNNFRWNMSPIAVFAQATEIGRTSLSLPREHDEFLRAKAPAIRVERFNMSSPSEAT